MHSGNRKEAKRVVPRWVVVFGILVITSMAVYGLSRIVIPVQRAAYPQGEEIAPTRGSANSSGSSQRRAGPLGFVRRLFGGGPPDMAVVESGEVMLMDAEQIIDASGSLTSLQSGEMYWGTSGIVDRVLVQVGDSVKSGDVLMELDPLSAPQNVIMAQADLISARKLLNDLNNPTTLQISTAKDAVSDAQEHLDQLREPTSLAVAKAQQTVAEEQEVLDLLQDPSALVVANARQEVADANEALTELLNPTDAQMAAAEEAVAVSRESIRDKQDTLNELLDPDIKGLKDNLRDTEFDLALAEQDVELANIGTSTSNLENARDKLEKMEERHVNVQKGLQACIVYKVEQDDERDYKQLTVTEEVVHNDFTFFVGTIYEVFEETATALIENYGSIVETQYLQQCDPLRAVTVDGVTRTLAEADEDLLAAQDGLREAELQVERTRIGNTTALDTATKAVQDAREKLDDALGGVDPVDLAVAEAAVDDATGQLSDIEDNLAKLLDPDPEDIDLAAARLDDAKTRLEQLLEPKPEDIALAVGKLEDAQEQLEQLVNPRPSEVALAKATLEDMQEQLEELLLGPDEDDVTAAETRVIAAEAILRLLHVEAQFDGQVLAVNYLPGDATEQSMSAVKLANMEHLRVEVTVDETEVSGILLGQPTNLTFDALPSVELAAEVTHVAPYGETVQGLVRYPVTVTLKDKSPDLMLGMTANVQIVTEVLRDALAVPIDAVQYDDEGEYVMALNGLDRDQTRVPVKSGVIQDDQVVVIGELRPGQKVVIFTPKPTESGSPFGG